MAKKSPIAARELAIFCRQISLIIGSDITIQQGVEMLVGQAESPRLQKALKNITAQMDEGMPFADAFAAQNEAFPDYLTGMVLVGSESGMLDVVFAQMADYYEKEHKMQRKVSAALTYPSVLTALMLGVIALLVLRILPMFEQILTSMGGTMPGLTRGLMDMANFLVDHIIWLVIAVALIIILYAVYKITPFGKKASAQNQLRSPITGSVRRRVMAARFARSTGILLQAGVPILQALNTVQFMTGNEFGNNKVTEVMNHVSDGKTLTEALQEAKLFPPLFIRLISVGETTGHLDEMMLRSAGIYDEEVDDALERLTTAIEPFLIIILSVIVGIILLSVMLPMINIMAQIG